MEGRLWVNTTTHLLKGCLNGAASSVGGGSTGFDSVTAGTNTAALLVGNGGSLGTTGTGTITANKVSFTLNPQTGGTYTTTATDSCDTGIITNVGNSGTLAITLLNDPPAQTAPVCMCTGAAQIMTVAPSAGETMYFNGATASLVTSPASIGSCLRVTPVTTGSGAIWIVTSYAGPLS